MASINKYIPVMELHDYIDGGSKLKTFQNGVARYMEMFSLIKSLFFFINNHNFLI